MTADLVGDYLFSDPDFINNLSAQNRNVFQKIFDEIKYLCKVVTAGSKEARELEKVKRAFEEAYRESGTQKNTADGGVKYRLGDTKDPTWEEIDRKGPINVVDISEPQTLGTFAERRRQIMSNVRKVIAKPYLNKDTGAMIFLTEKSYKHIFSNLGEIQINAAEHLPELIENAVLVHSEKPTHGSEYANGVYTFFAASKSDTIRPVKIKVKEYTYSGQDLPQNIKAYFDNSPEGYAASYDAVVLEVEAIEKSPSGSAKDMNQNDPFLNPDELSTIKVADLLNLVKGDAEKYIPKPTLPDTNHYQSGDIYPGTPIRNAGSTSYVENSDSVPANRTFPQKPNASSKDAFVQGDIPNDIGPVRSLSNEGQQHTPDSLSALRLEAPVYAAFTA